MLKNNIFLFKGDEFMKKHIISIGRQYGCGAHEIATKLSEKLGIPYYDKEIINEAFFTTFRQTVFQTLHQTAWHLKTKFSNISLIQSEKLPKKEVAL